MNITQLEYIKAVAELRGIRKAASRLHVTPQAISSSIHRLESELGVRLLERHKNELEPTAFGLRFANRVGPILMALQDLERMAKKETGAVGEEGHFLLYVFQGSMVAEIYLMMICITALLKPIQTSI